MDGYMQRVIVCTTCDVVRKYHKKVLPSFRDATYLCCCEHCVPIAAFPHQFTHTHAHQPASQLTSTPNSCSHTTICRRVHCVEHVHSTKHILKLRLRRLWHIVRLPLQWQNTILCSSNDTCWIENESDSGGRGSQQSAVNLTKRRRRRKYSASEAFFDKENNKIHLYT